MPDKAIDLVDEAASARRLQQESKPDSIQDLDRQIMTIQIELESLRKESDAASKERKGKLEESLVQKQEDVARLTEVWNKEKSEIEAIKRARSDLEKARAALENAQREGDYSKASELRYSTIPSLQRRLTKESSDSPDSANYGEILGDSVSTADIEAVVSRQTGIPVTKLMSGEIEKLVHMENTLRQSIRGQDEALVAVANSVRLQRAGLSGENRPIASFLCLG